jgi:hypothetical protein
MCRQYDMVFSSPYPRTRLNFLFLHSFMVVFHISVMHKAVFILFAESLRHRRKE